MDIEQLKAKYVKSKQGSWSPVTLEKEGSRLKGITLTHLKEPEKLYEFLKKERELSPYTLRTYFIRAGEFAEFLREQGVLKQPLNLVKAYMANNARLFKHSYNKKQIEVTFDEAAKLLNEIEDKDIRTKALQLLFTGMRYTESTTVTKDGTIVGKGGWHRDVPLAKDMPSEFDKSYHTFYRALKKVGLTPHQLRALCATKLVDLGAQEADLMKIFGWRSSQMASKYTQAHREKQLTNALKDHFKETTRKDVKRGK